MTKADRRTLLAGGWRLIRRGAGMGIDRGTKDESGAARALRRPSLRTVLLVLLVAGPLTLRLADGGDSAGAWSTADAQGLPFVTRAVGTLVTSSELLDNPDGQTPLTTVPAGALVDIGGKVHGRSGIWWREVYWVRVASSAGARQGFVNVDHVELTAGVPPNLSLNDGDFGRMLVAHDRAAARDGDATATDALAAMQLGASSGAPNGGDAVDIPWLPETVTRWNSGIVAAANRHGIDPELLAIIVLVESGGDPRAGSHAGARGLTQVMPATGASIAVERGVSGFTADALWQPDTALDYGAYYVAQQLRSFGRADDPDWQQSVELAAAAYNGGPGTVLSGRYPAETTSYVRWVGGMWRERNHDTSTTFSAWMTAGGRHLVDAARTRLAYSGG